MSFVSMSYVPMSCARMSLSGTSVVSLHVGPVYGFLWVGCVHGLARHYRGSIKQFIMH